MDRTSEEGLEARNRSGNLFFVLAGLRLLSDSMRLFKCFIRLLLVQGFLHSEKNVGPRNDR